jgi:hypothetical protein
VAGLTSTSASFHRGQNPRKQSQSKRSAGRTLIVGEPQPMRRQLLEEHAILGLEIVDHVALVLVDPASQGDHEEPERIRKRRHEAAYQRHTAASSDRERPPHLPRVQIRLAWTSIELSDTTGSSPQQRGTGAGATAEA